MKNLLRRAVRALIALGCALGASLASATDVEATFQQLTTSTWSVSFVVHNDGTVGVIDSLSIYLPVDWATNLALTGTPAGWDVLAIQPDAVLASDGFIDLLSPGVGLGLAVGDTFTGLVAQFDWTGAAAPTAFAWSVNDPMTFGVLEDGVTIAGAPVAAVPEPSTYALLSVGLLGALTARRRAWRR